MTYTFIYSSKAEKEFIEAFNFYEEQLLGLGERFESCIDRKLKEIIRSPYLYPSKRTGLQECWVKEFPFLIVYNVSEQRELVIVTSIFHTSRNPRKKYPRQ